MVCPHRYGDTGNEEEDDSDHLEATVVVSSDGWSRVMTQPGDLSDS